MHASRSRPLIERTADVEYAPRRCEQCRLLQPARFAIPTQLPLDSKPRHAPGDHARCNSGRQRECRGCATDRHLWPPTLYSLPNPLGDHLRLVNWPSGTRGPTHMAHCMTKKRRVDCGREHSADLDATSFKPQLSLNGLTEGTNGRLGTRVGRHQRQPVKGDSRADIDDAACIARAHGGKRHARAVDGAMIGHFRHALEFSFGHIDKPAIDAVASAVDPYIHRTERRYDRIRGLCESFAICDVGLSDGGGPSERLHIPE